MDNAPPSSGIVFSIRFPKVPTPFRMRPDTRPPVRAHRASPPPCRRFGAPSPRGGLPPPKGSGSILPPAPDGRRCKAPSSRYVVPRQTSDPRALCTPDPAETACVSRTSSRRGRPRSTRRTTPASSETYRLRRPPPRSERTRTARGPSPAFIPGRPPYRTFRPQSGRPSPRARPRRSAPPAEVSPR